MKKSRIFVTIFLAILVIFYGFYCLNYFHQRTQLAKIYQEINKWGFGVDWSCIDNTDLFDDSYMVKLTPEFDLSSDIVIYIDQWKGNVYIVKDNGDTIWRYIHKGKEQ